MNKIKHKIPVQTGDLIKMDVESLASSGDGICRHKGYAIFLPTALPGDSVTVKIVKTTPRFGVARVDQRLKQSKDRIEAPCSVFPECGGCKLQNLSYQKQLEFKVEVLYDSIKRIGKIEGPESINIIPSDLPYYYRNKAGFAVQKRNKKLSIGFYRQGTHEVIDSKTCDALLPPINIVKEITRNIIEVFKISIYNEVHHKGFLRNIIVRHSSSTGDTLLGLVSTKGTFSRKFIEKLAEKISLTGTKLSGIVQNINTEKNNVILGNYNRILWGKSFMIDRLGNLNFHLSLPTFFQANPEQTVKLYDLIQRWTKRTPGLAIDAHSGAGGIALWLAQSGQKVVGFEEFSGSANDAIKNAEINGLTSCHFFSGTAEHHLSKWKESESPAAIVLDPPRKGCSEELISSATRLKPKQIIYVSCNPSTLARDLARLNKLGYKVSALHMIDMFPQTQHVESATLLLPQ